jgi:hypothetical protein
MVKTTFLIEMFLSIFPRLLQLQIQPFRGTVETFTLLSTFLHNQPVKTIALKCYVHLLHRLPARLFPAKYIYRRLSVIFRFAPFVTANPGKMIITFMQTFH